MASGPQLLRQLRHRGAARSIPCQDRSREKHILVSARSPSDSGNNSPDKSRPCPSGAKVEAEVRHGDRANTETSSDTDVERSLTIEVCQGPDCSGSGGGAAYLDIEDLVLSRPHRGGVEAGRVSTSKGGCRNMCAVGPNVHVLRRVANGGYNNDSGVGSDSDRVRNVLRRRKSEELSLRHFPGVDSSAACRRIVRFAVSNSVSLLHKTDDDDDDDDDETDMTPVDRILRRRADAKRWKDMRERHRRIIGRVSKSGVA